MESENSRLPLDQYESEEVLVADWQRTEKVKALRERNRILVEAEGFVSARPWSDWVGGTVQRVDLDTPSLEEFKQKVEGLDLRRVRERLGELDERIAEYKAYEGKVTEHLRHKAEITHTAYGLTTEERYKDLLSDYPSKFEAVQKALPLMEEIRDVYAKRQAQLEKQASPERIQNLLRKMSQLCKDAVKQKAKIEKSLEAPACPHAFKKTVELYRDYANLRTEYMDCHDAVRLVLVDLSTPIPEFPPLNENHLPYEVRRILVSSL